jgi:hypothetical protein
MSRVASVIRTISNAGSLRLGHGFRYHRYSYANRNKTDGRLVILRHNRRFGDETLIAANVENVIGEVRAGLAWIEYQSLVLKCAESDRLMLKKRRSIRQCENQRFVVKGFRFQFLIVQRRSCDCDIDLTLDTARFNAALFMAESASSTSG